MIDPAVLRVGRQDAAFPIRTGQDKFAVVAASNDARTVGRSGQDSAAVGGDATRIAIGRDEQDGLFTENEGGGTAEKMRSYDPAAADDDRSRTLDHGCCVAAIDGHR